MTERPFEKDPWAVSVLSYHKSKGLEWKHVILTGLERDYRKRLFAQDLFEVQLHRAADSDGGDARRLISLFPNLFGASSVPRCLEDQLRELLHYEAADRRVGREEARAALCRLHPGPGSADCRAAVEKREKRNDDSPVARVADSGGGRNERAHVARLE